jgi:hypothetical protein
MCFSATASFALSGVLTVAGVASIARNSSEPHRMFAALPLIFAGQQAAEGVVWLTSENPGQATLQRIAVAAFLGLALIIWPIWLPMSLQRIERNPARRRVLTGMIWFGGIVAVSALVLLMRTRPVAVIAGHSMRYDRSGAMGFARDLLVLLAYVVATVGPLFVSTASLTRTIGTTLVLSLVATALIERGSLTSVWCFFAAILSGLVLIAVGREQHEALSGNALRPLAEAT